MIDLGTAASRQRCGSGEPDRPTTGTRLAVLDGLRGLAILLVMFSHFGIANPPTEQWINVHFSRAVRAGWIGVDLFFVLSGFLITGILCDAKGSTGYFRNFYIRRVLRIFPLYYASLLLLIILLPAALGPWPGASRMQSDAIWYWSYLANVNVALRGWPPAPEYLGHFWSLAVEEQFYLFWPLLVFVLSRRALMRCCAGLILATLALRVGLFSAGEVVATNVLTPARLDALAIGALVALLAREQGGLRRFAAPIRAIGFTCGATILGLWLYYGRLAAQSPLVATVGYTVLAALFASLMVAALLAPASSGVARLWSWRPLVFFGKYSYGLYVLHPAVIFFWPAAVTASALQPLTGRWIFAFGIASLLMLIVCVGAALVSWHALEKHFLRLRFRFADTRTAPASVRSPARPGFSLSSEQSVTLPARK